MFLAPVDDSGRADLLDDPVEDFGVVASVEQDIGEVVAKRQPGVLRFKGLFCGSNQVYLPQSLTPPSGDEGSYEY